MFVMGRVEIVFVKNYGGTVIRGFTGVNSVLLYALFASLVQNFKTGSYCF